MATIGSFTKTDNGGFTGSVRTLTVNAKVRIAPDAEKTKDTAPDYRVHAGPAEIGAAWRKTAAETGHPYLSVKLDDPSFPQPIYANLVEAEDGKGYVLIWSRRTAN